MTSSKQRQAALKAARIYLEMRKHKLLEQGWGRGKHKIDLIASNGDDMEFIGINYSPEGNVSDITENTRAIDRLTQASQAWLDENKYRGKHKLFIIEIYGEDYSVMSFNEV